MAWASDGRTLAFTEAKPSGERDVWLLTDGQSPVPFVAGPFDEHSPAFSTDGRFLAYVSDETGVDEVYVQPVPGPGSRWVVSTAGGVDPVWSARRSRVVLPSRRRRVGRERAHASRLQYRFTGPSCSNVTPAAT